jgi:membrane protease YdiL (CAAX protease family)
VFFFLPVILHGAPGGVFGPLLFAISVGFSEEMLFRVLILGWLITRMNTEKAVLLSAFLFGIAHLHELTLVGLMNVVPQTMGGIILGAIYVRTRNPIGGIIAHTMWDWPIFMMYGLVSGGSTEGGMPPLLWTVIWGLFGVYGLYLVRTGVPAAGRVRGVQLDGPAAVPAPA